MARFTPKPPRYDDVYFEGTAKLDKLAGFEPNDEGGKMTVTPVESTKAYIGDSIYIEFVDGDFIMTTENGVPEDPSNVIWLSVESIISLMRYLSKYIKLPQR